MGPLLGLRQAREADVVSAGSVYPHCTRRGWAENGNAIRPPSSGTFPDVRPDDDSSLSPTVPAALLGAIPAEIDVATV